MSKNAMQPIHPGTVLQEEYLETMDITIPYLSKALKVPARHLQQIVQGKCSVTADMALRLAYGFNTTPEFWLNLQSTFDLRKQEIKNGEKIKIEVKVMIIPDDYQVKNSLTYLIKKSTLTSTLFFLIFINKKYPCLKIKSMLNG